MNTGEKIKHLRIVNNKSQDYVAERLGLNRSTISSYEIGRRNLSYLRAKQLGRIFHVKPDYFFEENEEKYTFFVDDLDKKEYLVLMKVYEKLKKNNQD